MYRFVAASLNYVEIIILYNIIILNTIILTITITKQLFMLSYSQQVSPRNQIHNSSIF